VSVFYTIREGFSGFKRAKLSTFVSIVTITISLVLLGLFALITVNAARLVQLIRDKVELEVFLDEPISKKYINELQEQLQQIKGLIQ